MRIAQHSALSTAPGTPMPFKARKATHRAIATAWGTQVEVKYTPTNEQSKKRVCVAFTAHLEGHESTNSTHIRFHHEGATLPSKDVIVKAIEAKLAAVERPAPSHDGTACGGVDEGPEGARVTTCLHSCVRVCALTRAHNTTPCALACEPAIVAPQAEPTVRTNVKRANTKRDRLLHIRS